MKEKSTFLYQVNVTRDCNLRCTHCYISTDKKVSSKYMTKEQFIDTFAQVRDFMATESSRAQYDMVDIHVIGGEPTMLGYDFFKETLPLVKSILDEMIQEYKLSIVTNLITKDAIRISNLFDHVATSYEVDSRFVSNRGIEKPALKVKWEKNVHKMSETRDTGVTTAVTKGAVNIGARKLLDYLHGDLGINKIHLGFFIPSGDGLINILDVFPTFEETSNFMIEATEWYIERRLIEPELFLNPVESMITAIYNNKEIDDIVCPIIPGSLDIDWDGETITCIEAGGEVGFESLGNIFNSSVTEILNSKAYKKERMKAAKTKPACIGCDEVKVCKSACGILHDFWNGVGECPGFKNFIKFIRYQVSENNIAPK